MTIEFRVNKMLEDRLRLLRRTLALWVATVLAGAAVGEETIVFVRHGEKPEAGLGQLDCQGLNRSLKLPAVIQAMFGKPVAILAPDPAKQKEDGGVLYDYVRPLATIEPTAIAFGMPVNTQIGLDDTASLIAELKKDAYRDGLVVVAWEHRIMNQVECQLLTGSGCDFTKNASGVKRSGDVVKWDRDDFDRMDIVRIDGLGPKPTIETKSEGLNGQPETCPR